MTDVVRPKHRNAVVTALLPMVLFAAAFPLGNFLGQTYFSMAAPASMGIGIVLGVISVRDMTRELNAVTGNDGFAWWGALVPVYNLYWMAVLLPAEVDKAKGAANKPARRSTALYLFVVLYALAADLNDLA